jgi:CRP-like cAMP-binding protein
MIVNRENLIKKLRKVYPFNLTEDDQLSLLADKCDVVFFKSGDMVFTEGAGARYLYILFEGQIEILKEQNQAIQRKNRLSEGDLFGEDIFLDGHERKTSARAASDTLLIRISLPVITRFFQRNPHIYACFQPLIQTYQMLIKNKQQLDIEQETIRFIGQPHKFYLYIKALAFLLVDLLGCWGIYSLYALGVLPLSGMWWACGLLLALFVFWIIWNFFDWANDLYIFTDKRVINQERSILVSESRDETPLDAIISISSQMNIFGRNLKFGHLFIKTFTGSLRLRNVPHIKETQKYLEFLIEKSHLNQHLDEKKDFEKLVRNRFGYETDNGFEEDEEMHTDRQSFRNSGSFFRRAFGIKHSEGDSVIYRTHWIILAGKTFIPFFLLLSLVLILIYMAANGATILDNQIILGVLTFVSLILLGWWIYRYLDWRNDQYIITPEQIIDVYRRPLGVEDKRAAPLENIQSIRYKRNGLPGLILNYGTVFIKVGNEDFTFDNVYNPLEVQQVLFGYLEQANLVEKRADLAEQQRQLADWMDAYQKVTGERKNRRGNQNNIDNIE